MMKKKIKRLRTGCRRKDSQQARMKVAREGGTVMFESIALNSKWEEELQCSKTA